MVRILKEIFASSQIYIGSRSQISPNHVKIDLEKPEDYDVMKDYDYVVNCDSFNSEIYEGLIKYCINQQITFIETAADPKVIETILQIRDRSKIISEQSGLFILGAGIFPGFSNLLCKQSIDRNSPVEKIELAIRYNVLSGAGKGMCRLMIDTIGSHCFWFEHHSKISSKAPFHSIKSLPFKNGKFSSLQVSLPETLFINSYARISSVKSYISFMPTIMNKPAYYSFNAIPYTGFLKKYFLKFLYTFFILFRSKLLRNKKTDIQISCVINDNIKSGIWFNDAFLAAGYFLASVISIIESRKEIKGLFTVEDIFTLEDVLNNIKKFDKDNLIFSSY